MSNTPEFILFAEPQRFVRSREGEIKVGQAIACLAPTDNYPTSLDEHFNAGRKVAIVGVPESIGPRANLGRGGAEGGWDAFQSQFYNLQDTFELPVQDVLMVGAVDCRDLMVEAAGLDANEPHQLARLRELCAILDRRVEFVLSPLFSAGFDVILVGGGHNNAYPLLTSLHQVTERACGAVNLDPHADFRPREGRHSGNGFSYAYTEGALEHYHIMSLHEGKNSAASLRDLNDANFAYHSIHQLYATDFSNKMAEVAEKAEQWDVPLGVEVDIDAVQFAPASAYNT